MDYFKKVFYKGSGPSELEGRLYDLLRNQQWHCLLNRSQCTIEQVNGRDALCFKRMLEDGETSDEDDTKVYKFILGSGMHFTEESSTPCESPGFSFLGTSPETRNTMKFLFEVSDPDNIRQMDKYEDILLKLKPYNNSRPSVEPTAPDTEEEDEDELVIVDSSTDDEIVILEDTEEEEVDVNNPVSKLLSKQLYTLDFDVKPVLDANVDAELRSYSAVTRSYSKLGTISIEIVSKSRYFFIVCLKSEGRLFFHHPLDSPQHMAFVEADNSIEWIGKSSDGSIWGMKALLSELDFEQLREEYIICEYEMKNRSPFKSLKPDEKSFILNSIAGKTRKTEVDSTTSSTDSYTFIDSDGEESTIIEEDEETEEEEEEEEEYSTGAPDDGEKNSGLAVGFVSDRAFVARGKKIGVFKITENNQLEFSTTINDIASPGPSVFDTPSQMMLHQQDNKMLMLNEGNRNSIFCMDMNRGEIVDEWKTDADGYKVNNILPENRLAQLEDTQTFVGVNSNGAFRIDPRMKAQEKQMNNFGFRYGRSTNTQFSCAATTESGDLIMGSGRGDVRLFNRSQLTQENLANEMKTKAKNQLRLAGDPVIGVDVTSNGDWVLATCATYLMVIPVKVNGVDGFDRSLTGDNRLPGLRLELSRDHVWEMGGRVSFTVAHFNRDFEGKEKTIVTSTGPYVVTWDFIKVTKGLLDEYQIKQYKDNIVDEQFKFGEDKAIIVTLPDDVKIAKRVKKN